MLSNVTVARALDKSIISYDVGLPFFQHDVRPLQRGERRVFVEAAYLDESLISGGRASRSHIVFADSIMKLELANEQSEFHTLSDCGSTGLPAGVWLHTAGAVCGSHASDLPAHDVHNSVKRGRTQKQLQLLVIEYGLLANWTNKTIQ